MLYPIGKIIYLYHIKQTYALVMPIKSKIEEVNVFLPKGTYIVSLCIDEDISITYPDIQGNYEIYSSTLLLKSDFVVKRSKPANTISNDTNDTNTRHILTRTNLPFPWTHNISGIIYLSSLETFILPHSSNVNVKILFRNIPKNCYLKLETFIDAI